MSTDERLADLEGRILALEKLAKRKPSEERPGCFRPTIALCAKLVALEFGIESRAMMGEGRSTSVALPRQVAIWLAHKVTGRSSSEVGRYFRRDHSTAKHSRNAVEQRRESDPGFKCLTDNLFALFVGDAL